MLEKQLISIIMSTKDTEKKMLEQAVESILHQTYKNIEFIIVCDGSTNDLKILKKYNDSRIKLIVHEKSVGLTKSLNEALKCASGEYIARMDSDDISILNRLEIQCEFLNVNKDIDVCSMYAKFIGDKNGIMDDIFIKPYQKKAELFIYNRVVHPCVMIRKSFIEKYKISYDETYRYSQDYELWARICKFSDIYIIPQIGINYRIHKKQISQDKIIEQNELCRRIYLRNLEELGIENPEENVKFLFYLSNKTEPLNDFELIENFIKNVICINKEKKIYDDKTLKDILYYRYIILCYRKMKIFEVLKTIFKFDLLEIIANKIMIKIKFLKYN